MHYTRSSYDVRRSHRLLNRLRRNPYTVLSENGWSDNLGWIETGWSDNLGWIETGWSDNLGWIETDSAMFWLSLPENNVATHTFSRSIAYVLFMFVYSLD